MRSIPSGTFPKLIAPPCPKPLPSLCPRLEPGLKALLSSRQRASAFNQPLSFDTSKVINMDGMFYVRPARLPCTQCPVVPFPLTPPSSRLIAPLLTRQLASAFNQPLSLDTSSVTSIETMFWVRSARVPCAQCPLELPTAHAFTPRPSRLLARTSPRIRMPSFRLSRKRQRSTSR